MRRLSPTLFWPSFSVTNALTRVVQYALRPPFYVLGVRQADPGHIDEVLAARLAGINEYFFVLILTVLFLPAMVISFRSFPGKTMRRKAPQLGLSITLFTIAGFIIFLVDQAFILPFLRKLVQV